MKGSLMKTITKDNIMKIKTQHLMPCLVILFILAVLPINAKAAEFTKADIIVLDDMNDFDTVDAVDSRTITSSSGSDVKTYYLQLNLKEESWVYFTGNYSLYNHDGAGTDVAIYTNASMNNKKGTFGWGYWRYNESYSDFLKAGTYYVSVSTNKENYTVDFQGNVNIMAVAIPVSKIFNTSITVAPDKKSATVSFKNVLGKYMRSVQYQEGSIALSNVSNSTYWNNGTAILTPSNDVYSFTSTSNTNYTIAVQTTAGSRYSSIISVSGLESASVNNEDPATSEMKKSKVNVSSANSKTKKTVYLKWKKNKYADGYKVYRSTKKKKGYKCIATLKGKKKVSYTDKNVKSNKVYYYKVRAYRKKGKNTIYSGYSPVKRVKVK